MRDETYYFSDVVRELETILDNSRTQNTGSLYNAYWAYCPKADGPEDIYGMGPAQAAAYNAANSLLEGNEDPEEFQSTIVDLINDIKKDPCSCGWIWNL